MEGDRPKDEQELQDWMESIDFVEQRRLRRIPPQLRPDPDGDADD